MSCVAQRRNVSRRRWPTPTPGVECMPVALLPRVLKTLQARVAAARGPNGPVSGCITRTTAQSGTPSLRPGMGNR